MIMATNSKKTFDKIQLPIDAHCKLTVNRKPLHPEDLHPATFLWHHRYASRNTPGMVLFLARLDLKDVVEELSSDKEAGGASLE